MCCPYQYGLAHVPFAFENSVRWCTSMPWDCPVIRRLLRWKKMRSFSAIENRLLWWLPLLMAKFLRIVKQYQPLFTSDRFCGEDVSCILMLLKRKCSMVVWKHAHCLCTVYRLCLVLTDIHRFYISHSYHLMEIHEPSCWQGNSSQRFWRESIISSGK